MYYDLNHICYELCPFGMHKSYHIFIICCGIFSDYWLFFPVRVKLYLNHLNRAIWALTILKVCSEHYRLHPCKQYACKQRTCAKAIKGHCPKPKGRLPKITISKIHRSSSKTIQSLCWKCRESEKGFFLRWIF